MKKTKLSRFVFVLSVLIFLIFPIPSSKAEILSGNEDNLYWELSEDGLLTISGPGQMNKRITMIPSAAWNPYKERITDIIIQEGITYIIDSAFKNCTNLKSVTIPTSVSVIKQSAFSGCIQLQSINFSTGLASIEKEAFKACEMLSNVILPESIISIGESAFSDCLNLQEIYIPRNVTDIDAFVFKNCGSKDSTLSISNMIDLDRYWMGHDFHLVVERNSLAEKYAKEYDLSYLVGKKMTLGWKARLIDKVDSIIKQCITENMTEKQKAKVLHDWIVNHVRYGKSNKAYCNGAALAILYGRGYCDGFSIAYQLLLSKAGLSNTIISGNGKGQSHMWNLVYIDEQWYHVDTTFDSPGKSKYFMLTDEQISLDHEWNSEYLSADRNIVSSFFKP